MAQGRGGADLVPVNGRQLIADFYSRPEPRAPGIHAVRDQSSALLHPPHAVRRQLELAFLLEVDPA